MLWPLDEAIQDRLKAIEVRLHLLQDLPLHFVAHDQKIDTHVTQVLLEALQEVHQAPSLTSVATGYMAATTVLHSLALAEETGEVCKSFQDLASSCLNAMPWEEATSKEVQLLFRSPGDVSQAAAAAAQNATKMQDAVLGIWRFSRWFPLRCKDPQALVALLQAAKALSEPQASAVAEAAKGATFRGLRRRLYRAVQERDPVFDARPHRGYISYVEKCMAKDRRPLEAFAEPSSTEDHKALKSIQAQLRVADGLAEETVEKCGSKRLFAARGIDFQWDMTPQGTGAMGQKLDSEQVDVAVMLSEGAVARIAQGSQSRVIGTYVKSPLRWGIHVKKGSPIQQPKDLKGRVFGVSRMLSGSHLMAHVFANQQGWEPATDAPLKIVGDLGCKSLSSLTLPDSVTEIRHRTFANCSSLKEVTLPRSVTQIGDSAFTSCTSLTSLMMFDSVTEIGCGAFEDCGALRSLTLPKFLTREWDIIGEVPTPWPCFLFVASAEALASKEEQLQAMVEITKGLCDEFKANAADKTVQYVSENHALGIDDAREWLDGTEWACSLEVSQQTFVKTQEALITIGQLQEAVPHQQLHAPICRVTEGSTGAGQAIQRTHRVRWHEGVEAYEAVLEVGGRRVLGGYFKPCGHQRRNGGAHRTRHAMAGLGIPVKLLHEGIGHTVTCELKTGEMYRGHLMNCEDNMNAMLEGVTVTGRDGKVTNLEQVYLRGSQIRYFILPDMLRHAPMFKKKARMALFSDGGRRVVIEAETPHGS
eukprot:g14943.t1